MELSVFLLNRTVNYSANMALQDLFQVGPIVAVTIALLLAMIADLVLPAGMRRSAAGAVTVLGLIGALVADAFLYNNGRSAYYGFATGDNFAVYFHAFFAILGLLTVAAAHAYLRRRRFLTSEFYVLLLAATAGMMVLGSSTSLVSIFLGLELLSISLYILAGYARRDSASQEAGTKYLLMGGFASAFVAYGMALIYGGSGTTLIPEIAKRVTAESANNPILLLGVILIGVGFAFKVSAAPFQMWTPDVYQGSPIIVTAFMSVGTKAAAFAMIMRVFDSGLPGLAPQWQALLAFTAAASMVVGNLGAIAQTSIKRLLAYSGIAQAGYILIGVLAGHADGQGAVLFYLFGYMVMNFGAFAVVIALAGPDGDVDRMSDLNGLGQRRPLLGVALTVFMFSLAGFPPGVGFIGKFFLFAAGVAHGFTWLVVLAVLMSVVSVYYYVRVVVHVWTPGEAQAWPRLTAGTALAVAITGVLSIAVGIYPVILFLIAQAGAQPVAAGGG